MMRALADALSSARSVLVTTPLIYLSTLVMGTLSLLASLVDSGGRLQHSCARWWARSVLFFSGVRVRMRGMENIEPGRTYVFAANHQSYMDIPVAFACLPAHFRIMAKASLFRIPFIGWHLRRAGHLAIDRRDPRRAARSLLEAASHVKQGMPVYVFPEGGRSLDGRIGEFKAGTFLLAIKAGVPVVPITLKGTRAVLPVNSWHIRPGQVELVLHAPIPTTAMHSDSAEELSARVRGVIAADFAGVD